LGEYRDKNAERQRKEKAEYERRKRELGQIYIFSQAVIILTHGIQNLKLKKKIVNGRGWQRNRKQTKTAKPMLLNMLFR